MLKLTGSPGPGHPHASLYRVIDDQTGGVVLNVTRASYVHEAGSPPRLMLEVQGAPIDAEVLVAGEVCHVTGDGHNTNVTAPDGVPLRNVLSVEVDAGPTSGVGRVLLREATPHPEEATAEPEATEPTAPEPEPPPGPADEPETPAPLEATPADPTEGGSAAESVGETSNDGAEAEAPAPRASRRPRG